MPIRWCVSASSDCRRSPLITLLFGAWNGGEVLILAIYLQRVLGYSPLEAGLASVPQGLAGLTAGLVGARLADRFGIKALLLATTAIAVAGHLLLSWLIAAGGYVLVAAALLAVGLGNGGTAFAATVAGSAGVADLEQGIAGGLINSARQIGSALGVAALMDVATSFAAHHQMAGAAALAMGYREALLVAAGLAAAAFVVSMAFIPSEHDHQAPRCLSGARFAALQPLPGGAAAPRSRRLTNSRRGRDV